MHSAASFVIPDFWPLPEYWWLREESRKGWDYCFTDKFVHVSEVPNREQNPFTIVSESHIHPDLWWEVHVLLGGERKAHYAALVDYFRGGGQCDGHSREVKLDRRVAKGDVPMFIDVPKEVQSPKVRLPVGIPTVIRLKRLHNGDCFGGEVGSAFPDVFLCADTICAADRKAEISTWGCGCQGRQLPSEVVEGRPQVVDEVSGDCAEIQGREIVFEDNDILTRFQIIAGRNSIAVRPCKVGNAPIEYIKVCLRPLNLQIGIKQAWHI